MAPLAASSSASDLATRVEIGLRAEPNVVSLCLLGSLARGDASPDSDVDLLVVTTDEDRPTRLLEAVGSGSDEDRLSLIVQSRVGLARLAASGALFVLHLRTEGVILFDREHWLAAQLKSSRHVRPDPGATLEWARRELRLYRAPERFNGLFLFPLARLYSIGRAVAIALSVEDGAPEFSKERPFFVAASRRPHLRDAFDRLVALRPFHEHVAGKSNVLFPFDHRGADAELREAVRAVERLLPAARR